MSGGYTSVLREQTKVQINDRSVPMREVRFWDMETGERVADYHGEEDCGFGDGALSPDGRSVAVADFGRLCILETSTGKTERVFTISAAWASRPAFSHDESLVATPVDNTIGIFERSTGRRLHYDERIPVGRVVSAAWSPAGDRIATGHSDGFVRVWDAATGVLVWNKALAPIVNRIGWSAHPAFLCFSRDGKALVAGGRRDDPVTNESGIAVFFDAATGRVLREFAQKVIRWGALAPDERMLVVATSQDGADPHFVGVEVRTGRNRWENPSEGQREGYLMLKAVQFEPKPPWFIAVQHNGNVIRFNGLTGHEQRRFLAEWRTPEQQKARQPREPYMIKATISVDGHTVVSSQMEWVYVWHVESGTLRRKFRHPHRYACDLALSPDGRTLATSDIASVDDHGDDTIRLYDIETGEQVFALENGDGRAYVLAFSPDGHRLFAGFDLGSAIVWDVRRG
jgi:WD40 repeat protein